MAQLQKQCHIQELGICCPIKSPYTERFILMKLLDKEKNYALTHELMEYMKRARRAEKRLMRQRQKDIAEFDKLFIEN